MMRNKTGQDVTERDETRWDKMERNRIEQEEGTEMDWTVWDRTRGERAAGGSMREGRTELEGGRGRDGTDGTERNGTLR